MELEILELLNAGSMSYIKLLNSLPLSEQPHKYLKPMRDAGYISGELRSGTTVSITDKGFVRMRELEKIKELGDIQAQHEAAEHKQNDSALKYNKGALFFAAGSFLVTVIGLVGVGHIKVLLLSVWSYLRSVWSTLIP